MLVQDVLQQETVLQLVVSQPKFGTNHKALHEMIRTTKLDPLLSAIPLNPPCVNTQGRHMDRLFTICYLPVCLLLLGVVIKFNTMPARPRILTSFAAFTLIMLGLPLVGDWWWVQQQLCPMSHLVAGGGSCMTGGGNLMCIHALHFSVKSLAAALGSWFTRSTVSFKVRQDVLQ